jgi:hypothetical protein
MQARCRAAFLLFFLPLFCLSTGCNNTRTSKLENELRTRDQQYRDALEEQRRMEGNNIALRNEIEALRQSKIAPDQPASTFGVKRIALGRETGGVDLDNIPGDELLKVVVEPRDSEGHSFKAPGCLQIYALEITPQGIKTPLCMWDITPDKLHESWKSGLLSVGYTLTLPWKVLPIYENVRIIARFATPDQRAFEADRDIKVRLVPGASQKRPEVHPEPMSAPALDMAPTLLPTSSSSGREPIGTTAPQQTQWQPLAPEVNVAPQAVTPATRVTIGQPQRLDYE